MKKPNKPLKRCEKNCSPFCDGVNMTTYRILAGDCITRMNMMDRSSVDNIITDPPYEIGFMGNGWDNTGIAYNPATWRAAHRVLKQNGLMLVFGATRTHHRIAHAIQRAGFEIVDIIAWCYGTGFPKSHNIGKAIDKKNGIFTENKSIFVGVSKNADNTKHIQRFKKCIDCDKLLFSQDPCDCEWRKAPSKNEWDGWGTALKPAWEPIIVARKKDAKFSLPDYTPFHYIPKPSKSERSEGLEGVKNNHPTVKPIVLMEALVKEFTEEGSTVFDPFTGSGTTGIASVKERRNFIGCELTPEYIPLAKARIEYHLPREEE